jgi:hypothetical protein
MISTWWVIAAFFAVLAAVEVFTGFLREVGSRLFQLFLNLLQRLCDRYFNEEDDEPADSDEHQNEPTTVFNVGDNSQINVMMGNQSSEMPIDQDFDARDNNGS